METKRGKAGPPGAGDLGYFAGLKDRELRDEGYFLVEGRLLVERLLAAGLPPEVPGSASGGFEPLGILCVPSLAVEFEALAAGRCPVSVMGETDISALAGFPFHRGVIAAAKRPELPTLERWLVAALWTGTRLPALQPAPSLVSTASQVSQMIDWESAVQERRYLVAHYG